MTKTRSDVLRALADLSERFPEFRFGQLIVGLAWGARDFKNEAIYDVEDEELLAEALALLSRRSDSLAEDQVPSALGMPLPTPPHENSATKPR